MLSISSVVSPAVVIACLLALFLVAYTAQLLQVHRTIVSIVAVLVIYLCAELEACALHQCPIYHTRESQSAVSVGAPILFKSSDTCGQWIVHITVLMASTTEHSIAHI